MKFFEPAQRISIGLELRHHPILSQICLDLDGLQDGRCRKPLEVTFKIGRRRSVLCPDHQMQMTAHQTPGVDRKPLCTYKKIERFSNDLLISRFYKNVYLIYRIER